MPALPSIVSDFITSVKDRLTTGAPLGPSTAPGDSTIFSAGANGLIAMDMSAVFELLQDALSTSTPLVAEMGTDASVIVDGAATFVAGQQVGNYVIIVDRKSVV